MDPNVLNLIQGAAGAGGGDPVYVEDVFSTYVYNGNEGVHEINNGIDLSGEGGMVWIKRRNAVERHALFDTVRGKDYVLASDEDSGQRTRAGWVDSFDDDGFTLDNGDTEMNNLDDKYVSWTFRKAPGFFDVVTWSGSGTNDTNRRIPHGLDCVPGMIFVKQTSGGQDWYVYHMSTGVDSYQALNNASQFTSGFNCWGTSPTTSDFGINEDNLSASSGSYVAYIFAHDDQSFGDDEDESIIKCGTYTGSGSAGKFVDVGFEPQCVFIKCTDETGRNWVIRDNMRFGQELFGDGTEADVNEPWFDFNSTGFTLQDASARHNKLNKTYIYMAIRRGPMKTPEAGTEVFAVEYISTPTSGTTKFTTNFPVDMSWANVPSQGTIGWTQDRLRGYPKYGLHATQGNYAIMRTHDDYGESTFQPNNPFFLAADQTSITYGNGINNGDNLSFAFRRAPGFFDVVAYEGTGSYGTVSHSLGAIPYLIIVKNRSAAYNWYVQSYDLGKDTWLQLNNAEAKAGNGSLFDSTLPTDSVFSVANMAGNNASGNDYIAYLFGKLPGVCETGTYEGTGQNGGTTDLDFGFSPRFLLIKNADTNNYNWALFDSATGMSSSVGKYIRPNQSYDYSTGWTGANAIIDNITDGVRILDGNSASGINQSGDTHLYLAIA